MVDQVKQPVNKNLPRTKQPRSEEDLNRGMWLRNIRAKLGFSQEDLAEKLGVERTTVTAWEKADYRPSAESLIALANIVGPRLEGAEYYSWLLQEAGINMGILLESLAGERNRAPSPKPNPREKPE
jgi:transcriptional regulator with XRE-family HTH domain